VLGLVVTLRPKGQRFAWYVPTGDEGLGGRIESDLSAEIAVMCVSGDTGGEKCVELGLDGEARGIMSLGSCAPE